jgi:Leucine-rich repeat (LRR) protein
MLCAIIAVAIVVIVGLGAGIGATEHHSGHSSSSPGGGGSGGGGGGGGSTKTPAPTPAPVDIMACTGTSASLPKVECAAWQDFFNSTGGNYSSSSTGWQHCQTNLLDPCSCTYNFDGLDDDDSAQVASVTCSGTSITALSLDTLGITGPLPQSIGSLTALTQIKLDRNPLMTGTLPSALLALTALEVLQITSAGLTGPIPAAISSLTKLTNLGIAGNRLTGTVPSSLSALTALTTFDIGANDFSGSLPASLSSLTTLKDLSMQCCGLTGALPSLNWDNLKTCSIGGPQFDGSCAKKYKLNAWSCPLPITSGCSASCSAN